MNMNFFLTPDFTVIFVSFLFNFCYHFAIIAFTLRLSLCCHHYLSFSIIIISVIAIIIAPRRFITFTKDKSNRSTQPVQDSIIKRS